MKQFMSNLVCEGFASFSTEICIIMKMLKCKKRNFDDATLEYSTSSYGALWDMCKLSIMAISLSLIRWPCFHGFINRYILDTTWNMIFMKLGWYIMVFRFSVKKLVKIDYHVLLLWREFIIYGVSLNQLNEPPV